MSRRFPLMRKFVMRILTYILHPEFRPRELFIRRQFKRMILGALVSMFLLMAIEITSFESRIGSVRHKLKLSMRTADSLRTDAKAMLYVQLMDSFLLSPEYLRYSIFKETGIQVPRRVSDEHLALLAKEVRDQKMPMKLVLRVIKHESGFDSTAVNPSSGAWGFMQTVNGTFDWYYGKMNLSGGRTTSNNIKVGVQRLKDGFDYWKGRQGRTDQQCWELSLACYAIGDSLPRAINAVPDGVKDYINYVMYSDK